MIQSLQILHNVVFQVKNLHMILWILQMMVSLVALVVSLIFPMVHDGDEEAFFPTSIMGKLVFQILLRKVV